MTCDPRKPCLKFINPNSEDPEKRKASFGTPYQYDENLLACLQCEQNKNKEGTTMADPKKLETMKANEKAMKKADQKKDELAPPKANGQAAIDASRVCPKCGEKNPVSRVTCAKCHEKLIPNGNGKAKTNGNGKGKVEGKAPEKKESPKAGKHFIRDFGVRGRVLLSMIENDWKGQEKKVADAKDLLERTPRYYTLDEMKTILKVLHTPADEKDPASDKAKDHKVMAEKAEKLIATLARTK